MYPEEQGIARRPQMLGPLTRAAQVAGIAQLPVPLEQSVAFADGGVVGSDGLTDAQRAKLAGARASLGVSATAPVMQPPAQAQPQSVQQAPRQQGITSGLGIIGVLKGRQQQIDQAAGYAEGGIIRGPGTAKSDSIPARVNETGEEIRVGNGERIVSEVQGQFLESVARGAGYKSLDDMLEDGTGKPVGPTIRVGKRAAADGLPPDQDPFAYRGGSFAPSGPSNGPDSTALTPVAQGILAPSRTGAAPRTPGAAQGIGQLNPNERISAAIGAADQGSHGVGKPELKQPSGDHGVSQNNGIAAMPTGRNQSGIITADSAKAAMAEPMQRSGGIFGTIDMKGVNAIMERENKARGEMIDSMIEAQGGNGIAVLPENYGPTNDHNPLSDGLEMVRRGIGNRTQAGIAQNLINAGVAMRGQDQRGELARDGILGNRPRAPANPLVDELTKTRIESGKLRNDQTQRLGELQQQLVDETDPEKRSGIAEQIRSIGGKAQQRPADQLNLPQRRSNAEIAAARLAVAGLTPEEIKRKTANFTATGRENPEYDPTLAKSVSLANRRMYGADDEFDRRQQAQQPQGIDGDVMTRFRADQAMHGHKLGKQTEQGVEVLDASGKLIGHYH